MPTICVTPGLWDQIKGGAPFMSRQQWQATNLYILCQIIIANGGNPDMSTCEVSGLWDQIKGNPPFLSDQQFYAENINLLCQLAGGGGGGGSSVNYNIWRDAPVDRATFPDNETPPADVNEVWVLKFRDGTSAIQWDPVNQVWG